MKLDWDKIKRMHMEGLGNTEIAERLGYKPYCVDNVICAMRKRGDLPKMRNLDEGKVIALYNAGWNLSSIAFEVHGDLKQVENIIKKEH